MGMVDCGNGLATRLKTIQRIKRAFGPGEIPDSIPECPCAIVLPGESQYDRTFSGKVDITFRILILINNQDKPSALSEVVRFAEPEGKDSVRAAVNKDTTLGGAADDCQVRRCAGAGATVWAGTSYLSTEFEVIVYA